MNHLKYLKYLILLIGMPCFARVPDGVEEVKICIFIFLTAFLFSVIPGALLKAFKKNSIYNMVLGVVLSGVLFFFAHEASINLAYCIKVTIALLSGWILSHFLACYFVFKHYKS